MNPPNRRAEMYGIAADDTNIEPVTKSEPISEETYIEHRKHVAVIRVGDVKVAVPTVAHAQELVKQIITLDRHVKQLTAENRRMRAFINKMVGQMTKMQHALDHKMDKL